MADVDKSPAMQTDETVARRMENTSEIRRLSDRERFYYQQRYKNRVSETLVTFISHEVDRLGLSRKYLAERLGRDPAQITRWLSAPSNLTLDTISDLLLALDSEMDSAVVRFDDRPTQNYVHRGSVMSAREKAVEAAIELIRDTITVEFDPDGYDWASAAVTIFEAAMKDAGWVMVPVEPTPKMLAAFHEACDENGQCLVKTGYRAMLSARPGNALGEDNG